MAYISVTGTTTKSISVRVNGLDTGYSRADRTCTWLLNGRSKGSVTLGANASSGGAFTFSGLTAGTSYDITASINAPGWSSKVTLETSASTDDASIEPWDWNSSNGNASASQTKAAYNAVTNRGRTTSFSYLVWNDMVNKVNEIVTGNGKSWDSSYASLAATRMSDTSKKITAARFNSLATNLNRFSYSKISMVSKGGIIYGRYFTQIASAINSCV